MANNKKVFEFECPQYVDFQNLDELSGDSSFFDRHTETECLSNIAAVSEPSTSTVPTEVKKTVDPWETFSSRLTSTPAANCVAAPFFHPGFTIAKKNVPKVNPHKKCSKVSMNKRVKKTPALKQAEKVCRVPAIPRRLLVSNSHAQASAVVSFKPPAKFVVPRNKEVAVANKAQKRKIQSPQPKTVANKRTKLTQPKTPECLRRSKAKKVLKSSEDLELEKIAVLQKRTADLVKRNQRTMNKIMNPKMFSKIEESTKSHKEFIAPRFRLPEKDCAVQSSVTIDGFKAPFPKEKNLPAKAENNPVSKHNLEKSSNMPYFLRDRNRSASDTLLNMSNISNKSKNLPIHCGLKFIPKTSSSVSSEKTDNKENLQTVDLQADSEMDKKAQRNVAVWKKTVEEELQKQKTILKKSNRGFKSVSTASKSLAK